MTDVNKVQEPTLIIITFLKKKQKHFDQKLRYIQNSASP